METSSFKNIARNTCGVVAALGLGLGCFTACVFPRQNPATFPSVSASGDMVLAPDDDNAEGAKEQQVVLYFPLGNEPFLAAEDRDIKIPEGSTPEKEILRKLIQGPLIKDMLVVIPNKTQVVNVEASSNHEIFYITLSPDFLAPMPLDVPTNWNTVETLEKTVLLNRRLAVYSMVNSITEMGKYDRVQFLIDDRDLGATRPTWADMGFTDVDQPNLPISVLTRDDSLILTPINTVSAFFESFANKQWSRAEGYLTLDTNTFSATNTMADSMKAYDATLVDGTVTGSTISNKGKCAVVTVNYTLRAKAGNEVQRTTALMRLTRENGIWKIHYSSIQRMLTALD